MPGREGPEAVLLVAAAVALGLAAAPVPGVDDGTFAVHMARHVALVDLVPPLLLIGLRPGWLRRARPVPAALASTALLVAWHVPAAFDAALRVPALHLAEHACFLLAGVLLWAPVLGVTGGPAVALGFLLATRSLQTVLGNVLLWAPDPLYATTASTRDQRLAAAVMLGEGLVVGVLAAAWLFALLVRDERIGPSALVGPRER